MGKASCYILQAGLCFITFDSMTVTYQGNQKAKRHKFNKTFLNQLKTSKTSSEQVLIK